MSRGKKVLFITLALAGIMALSMGSLVMADSDDTIVCDETCQQQCLGEQQRICEQSESCLQIAEQTHTRLNWTDGTCPGNALGQQGENQTQGNRCPIS